MKFPTILDLICLRRFTVAEAAAHPSPPASWRTVQRSHSHYVHSGKHRSMCMYIVHMCITYMCAFRFVCFYFQHAHAHTSLAYQKYVDIPIASVGIIHTSFLMLIERCTMHLHRRASLSSRFKAIDECHLFITQLPGQQIYWPH